MKRRWSWPTRPDQLWVADFSYVWTPAGFCYVSFITDVFSRRILGWRVTTSKATPLVTSALEQALFTRRRTSFAFTADGLVHHSAGAQYTSLAFTETLREAGITGSIGTVGDALDNALMESTIGLFKTEVIDHEQPVWRHWREVENATASWVHWYNHERLHSSIGNIPPAEYEQAHIQPKGTTTPSPPNNALHRIKAGSRSMFNRSNNIDGIADNLLPSGESWLPCWRPLCGP